jgi:hypothetical protein
MAILDFPSNPFVGQTYTTEAGITYQWNGTAWIVNYYDSNTQQLQYVGDLIKQVRTLLQDVDISSGQYRYSTDSLVMNLNQGMLEMYRIRPDIFLSTNFTVPSFSIGHLSAPLVIEPQFVPALVYYVVGMTQVRDDEGTQDTRASAFLTKFTAILVPPP